VHERSHNLRPGGQGSPNGHCCFLGGGSNKCLEDSNWRERHNNCPFFSGGLSPDGGRPRPCRGRPSQAPGGHAQIERSFSNNGRQPTAKELAITETVRVAVRSSATYLATTEPVQAQIAAAHVQLVAAFSKEMADADGAMLTEYGAMDAMDPLPQETVGRELDKEAVAEIDEHQP